MPLERALDSMNNLRRWDGAGDLSDVIDDDDDDAESDLDISGHYSHLGLEVEGLDGQMRFGGIQRKASNIGYWQGGSDWQNYATIVPLDDFILDVDARGGKNRNNVCFTLFPFCDPYRKDTVSKGKVNVLGDEISADAISKHVRTGGIMRRGSNYLPLSLGVNKRQRKSFRPALYRPRQKDAASSDTRHVRFAPTKTEVLICPIHRMSEEEKSSYWWSIEEFEIIKMASALLIQPEEVTRLCKTWLANGGDSGGAEEATEPIGRSQKKDEGWWHKYGDSRRGLEHFASPHEAPQILESYTEAVYQTLAEQERQRRRRGCLSSCGRAAASDVEGAERIARIYQEYTAWSRDLALASGASDADAVACDFDDDKRKSREYFLLKQILSNGLRTHRHRKFRILYVAPRASLVLHFLTVSELAAFLLSYLPCTHNTLTTEPDFMVPPGLQPKGHLDYSMVCN